MLTLLIIFGIAFIFVKLFNDLFDWRFDHRNWPRIKFEDFKKFYALNSNRWVIGNDYVKCKLDENKCEGFEFNFIDFCKYKRWKRKLDDHKRNADSMESIQRMMDVVKEDIAAAKEKENANQVVTAFKLLEELRKMNMDGECPSLIELLKKYNIE